MKPELKQFGDLGVEDFRRHPVWIGCHTADYDEPWYDDTDEETFRPWAGRLPADPASGMLLVRATIVLSDGTELPGFVTPTPGWRRRVQDKDFGTAQPHMFLPEGQVVSFWTGMVRANEQQKQSWYSRVGKPPSAVFPACFRAHRKLTKGGQRGVIRGLYQWRGEEEPAVYT